MAEHVAQLEMSGLACGHDQYTSIGRLEVALVEGEHVVGRVAFECISVAPAAGFLIFAPVVIRLRAASMPIIEDLVAESAQGFAKLGDARIAQRADQIDFHAAILSCHCTHGACFMEFCFSSR